MSWDDNNYNRVIPRDLFNDAKLLGMYHKFVDAFNEGLLPQGFAITGDTDSLNIGLTLSGDMYLDGIEVTYDDEQVALEVTYNAGKEDPYPLVVTAEERDIWLLPVFDDNGDLQSEFLEAFSGKPAQPAPENMLPLTDTWQAAQKFMNQLGVIGLHYVDGMLPDDFTFELQDTKRGFDLHFEGGTIQSNNLESKLNGKPVSFFMDIDDGHLLFEYDGVTDRVFAAAREMSERFKMLMEIEPEIPDPR